MPNTLHGKTVRDLNLGQTKRPVAVSSDGCESFADPDTNLCKGDHVLFVIEERAAEDLKKLFKADEG
ncbi:MAG: TrkA C-terminal domain-containing protein [Paracoccaceae bacterium]